MMKGNEQDCICAKNNNRHTRYCDTYRLREFMLKAAAILSEKPKALPPEEPKE